MAPPRRKRPARTRYIYNGIQLIIDPAQLAQQVQSQSAAAQEYVSSSSKQQRSFMQKRKFCLPHPKDLIFAGARYLMTAHNNRSFACFAHPLRLEALHFVATPLFNTETPSITAALVYNDTTILIPFKIVCDGRQHDPGLPHSIICGGVGGEMSFAGWLADLKDPPDDGIFKEEGWKEQHAWWMANGKTFNIMQLPTELRLLILEQAVGVEHYPGHQDQGPFSFLGAGSEKLRYPSWYSSFPADPTKRLIPMPNTNILFTCKQLYSETRHHLLYGSSKAFLDDSMLDQYLHYRPRRSSGSLDFLVHLDLDFSLGDYLGFFGFHRPFRILQHPKTVPAIQLKSLATLKTLGLHFRSTLLSASENPFRVPSSLVGTRSDGYSTPCQKISVDWILTCAKQYIEHIPRVYLTGYIKTSTKTKWETILADERHGKHHDLTKVKGRIMNWPIDNLPPKCNCTNPCRYAEYHEALTIYSGDEKGLKNAQVLLKKEQMMEFVKATYRFDYHD